MFFLALIITLSTASSKEIPASSSPQSAEITFRILGEGFHRDLVVSSGSLPSECNILFKWAIPHTYYVDPYKMWDSLENKTARFTRFVNTEQMAHQAEPNILYTMLEAEQGSSHSIPVSLRYSPPKPQSYLKVDAVPPMVFQSCTCRPNCQLNEDDATSQWSLMGYPSGLSSEFSVPVGNLEHMWYVTPVTISLSFLSTLYVFLRP